MKGDDALLAAVAHEVKTPLAVLRGFAELLANRTDEETRRQAPAAIFEAAEQLAFAVDDLLLAFELASDSLEPVSEPVALANLLPEVTGTLPIVVADRRLLGRALSVFQGASDVSVRVRDGVATVSAEALAGSQLQRYVAGRIAELHGGELRETPEGVTFTVPLG